MNPILLIKRTELDSDNYLNNLRVNRIDIYLFIYE
jgi:hypothetical protein